MVPSKIEPTEGVLLPPLTTRGREASRGALAHAYDIWEAALTVVHVIWGSIGIAVSPSAIDVNIGRRGDEAPAVVDHL